MNRYVIFEDKTDKKDKSSEELKEKIDTLEKEVKETKTKLEKIKNQDDKENSGQDKEIPTHVKGGKEYYEKLGTAVHVKPLEERQKKLYEIKKEEEDGDDKIGKDDADKNMVIVGHQEALRDDIKKVDQNVQRIDDLVEGAKKPLLNIRSDLGPLGIFYEGTVTAYVNKVSLGIKSFLLPPEIHDFAVEDINDVTTNKTFIFSSLTVKGTNEENVMVKYLGHKNTQKMKTIIKGLLIAKKQGVDLSGLAAVNPEELLKKFEELGKPRPEV